MLHPPDHQVAGHTASGGGLGPLVDGSGLFYKPLQSDERGANEAAFYASFSSDPRVPLHIRRFFPAFHGTQLLPPSSPSAAAHPHLVLQDLAAGLRRPSVIDAKIGSRTWHPASSDAYVTKSLKKDRETTSLALGFRISGLQIYDSGGDLYRPRRDEVKNFTATGVRRALRQFVSSKPEAGGEPDRELASAIYGGSDGVLAQLLELKAWFEDQTLFHFYSVSVLVVYEGDRAEAGRCSEPPRVKLVDFAHVVEGDRVIDHNFLGGICSLIKFISEILTDPGERSIVNNGSRLRESN